MIVIDTSAIYALLDRRDRCHGAAVAWYRSSAEELVTSPLILAEVDHLAASRAGSAALRAFRQDVEAGAYTVDWWATAQQEMVAIARQYDDLGLSLADASLVAIAARRDTLSVATFDARHFRAIRPLRTGAVFRLPLLDSA